MGSCSTKGPIYGTVGTYWTSSSSSWGKLSSELQLEDSNAKEQSHFLKFKKKKWILRVPALKLPFFLSFVLACSLGQLVHLCFGYHQYDRRSTNREGWRI